MKILKRLLASALAVLLLFCFSVNALAKEKYTYTVTFLAGTQGTFESADGLFVTGENAEIDLKDGKIVISKLAAGDVVSFNAQASVEMNADSKHYVKGVRLSGRDNNTVAASVFTVNADEDYVVAYGIKGNMTKYTVHYQDAEGNTLKESDIFYGNVGDKPVVAYRYISGYSPLVYGFTKTLSENEAENVFTFIYEKAEVEIIPGTTPGGDNQGGTSSAIPGGDDESDAPEENDPGSSEAPGTSSEGEDDEPNDDPEKEDTPIVDLDDEEVPLGNPDADDDSAKLPLVGMIAIIIIGLIALANMVFFILKKREAKDEKKREQ